MTYGQCGKERLDIQLIPILSLLAHTQLLLSQSSLFARLCDSSLVDTRLSPPTRHRHRYETLPLRPRNNLRHPATDLDPVHPRTRQLHILARHLYFIKRLLKIRDGRVRPLLSGNPFSTCRRVDGVVALEEGDCGD